MKKEFLILRAPEGSEGPTGAGGNGNNVPGVEQPKTDVPPEEEDPNKAENKPKTEEEPGDNDEGRRMPFDGYVLEDGIAVFVMGPVVINNYNIVCPCLEDEDPDNDAPAE